MFEKENPFPGSLRKVRSRGGETGEFHRNNFTEDEYDDLVYVSATPRSNEFIREKVHEYVPVWEHEWDDETGLVPADRMTPYCIDAIEEYPDKRIFFHFLQPHLSIQSSEGIEAAEKVDFTTDSSPLRKFFEGKISKQFPGLSPWILFQEGYVDGDVLWDLQREKLEAFFDAVEPVLSYCDGPTVITSDHGNCYGEKVHPKLPWKAYEHPRKLNHPSLRTVPWLEVDLDQVTSKETAEGTVSTPTSDRTDVAEDRLRDLGYI